MPPDPRPPATDPQLAERIRASFARQGAMRLLGASLAEIEAGRVAITLPFRPDVSQQHGYFHAGVVAAVADSAGGYAALTRMPPGSEVLSVEFKLNLIAPAAGDRIVATGEVVRAGRTLTVCELDVVVHRDGSATRCAVGLQTLYRADPAPPP